MDREKLLIIGCGDLGRRLAQQLEGSNIAITGLRRHPPASTPAITYCPLDASDGQALMQVMAQNFDTVVITLTPQSRSDEGYVAGYVTPAELLVKVLKQLQVRPRLILFVSSTAVYGQDQGEWVDEGSLTKPTAFNGKRLLQAEETLLHSGLPVSVLRLSGIYGPGRARLLNKVATGKAPLQNHWTNRIHADDAAGFMAHLLVLSRRQPLAPVYLVSDSEPARSAEVVSWLASQLSVGTGPREPVLDLNKRVNNRLLLASGFELQYPDYKTGFIDLLIRKSP
ncbi:MAG TPA: SDR family oxidoreductase [Cellvibrionaceae bacterium]